jgi:hypothetical protein
MPFGLSAAIAFPFQTGLEEISGFPQKSLSRNPVSLGGKKRDRAEIAYFHEI